MKENTHGGSRVNSGRKPIEDKKVTLSIYPHKSRIELIGIEETKRIAIQAIEKEFKKMLKKT